MVLEEVDEDFDSPDGEGKCKGGRYRWDQDGFLCSMKSLALLALLSERKSAGLSGGCLSQCRLGRMCLSVLAFPLQLLVRMKMLMRLGVAAFDGSHCCLREESPTHSHRRGFLGGRAQSLHLGDEAIRPVTYADLERPVDACGMTTAFTQ